MEDVCYPDGGGALPQNCLTLPSACLPVGTETPACRALMATQFVLEGSGQQAGARSMVHADATFLLAQAAGFSADDAWWIAAFDEVCDYGKFEAYDTYGEPLDSGLQTPVMEGFQRTNTGTGGTFFHYVSTYNGGSPEGVTGLNGLSPDVDDENTEFFLAHLRLWAQAGTGTSRALCTGGLTTESDAGSYGTGTSCYPYDGPSAAASDAGADAGNIVWQTAIFAGSKDITTVNSTGAQVIHQPDGGAAVLSPEFDSVVVAAGGDSNRIKDARLGIYLHSLADRISHNVCTDTAAMAGPTPDAWTEAWTSGPCDQGEHVLFHAWETGVDFTQVPAANRTTISALSAVQSELASFAAARGITPGGVSTSALISAMTTALQTADAPGRITALAAVSCANGLQPFPGAPACTTTDAGAGDAGTSTADGGSAAGGGGDDSGCSTSAGAKGGSFPLGGAFAWIGALGALGIRRRWRTRASK